jgi:catecholate siderophore receptor
LKVILISLLMRSITACALACCCLAPCGALRAQSSRLALAAAPRSARAVRDSTPADTAARFQLRIPAQPLPSALALFEQQTGIRVEGRDAVPGTIRSASVDGVVSSPEALRTILAGTGWRARFIDAGLVVLARASARDTLQTLGAVVVTADAARRRGYVTRQSLSATKTDVPLRDVPQAVTVIGRELMADQSMQSMTDVVRYVPGVTMGQGEGHRDAPTIRGNASTADFFVDGVRDDAQYLREVYNVERVETLKGANAMVFGRGGGGGVINRVTKEAQWAPVNALALEGGSWDHRRATLDVGQALGSHLAGRVNALYKDARSFRNGATQERVGINPTAALLLRGTMIRVGYEWFEDDRTVDRGIPSFRGRPSAAALETYFGDPDASRSTVQVHAATASVERGSSDGLMLRNRTRWATYDKFYQNVFASSAVNAAGTQVSLGGYNNGTDRDNLFNQTDVSYRVKTGAVTQTLLVGGELGRQRTDNVRRTGYFNGGSATSYAVDFAAPTVDAPVEFRQSASDADNHVHATVASAYVQDQVAFGAHLQAIGGVRYDYFGLYFTNNRNGQGLQRRDRMVSPRGGLVFKPVEAVSVYGTYSVSYLPSSGDQFSALTATTSTLKPEEFRNRELGIKVELRPDLAITGALYRLDRNNTSSPDPLDPTRVVQTGAQRTTGWEAGITGAVTGRWQVAGGYATQRAIITSRTSAAQPGAIVPLVPEVTYSLWNRVQLVPRVALGAGVVHQAQMFAAIDNTVTLPAFTRLDGAAFVTLSQNVRMQLNVENLLDERYYPTSHGNNNIMPGAPRTVRMTLTATR